MAISLDNLLKSVNKSKLSQLKEKVENGELSQMLGSIDTEKANSMIREFGLEEQAKKLDLEKLIQEVKKNPQMIETLKKML